MPNRLARETSPYLLQHANNPVDWYPWGEEALARSRREDRPIFLSIGYSACHWCHVMEHESFESPAIAKLLSDSFVCIKVDREERPDLDQIYMNAVQMISGRGGWPMSMFLTPELKPFYGGTYWPPTARMGMPGFDQVLAAVLDAWKNRRAELTEQAGQMTERLQQLGAMANAAAERLPDDALHDAAAALERVFDHTHGGFGGAPKFPHPMDLRVLLRYWRRQPKEAVLKMVAQTLDHMAAGGIYDHLGGGFHRYSVDERWLVPHFEKMLYDNALLAACYVEAYQATGRESYAQTARETLDYLIREMTAADGGFYSTLDADSEGEEGKFYVWSVDEIREILGEEEARLFCYAYDVTDGGNFEGHNILNLPKTVEQCAKLQGHDPAELSRRLAADRQKLLAVRNRRVWPGLDDKQLTGWNALAIDALAQAAGALDEPRYLAAAAAAADFVLHHLRRPDGRLLHSWRTGQAKFDAYLDDYAGMANALVSLYEASFDPRWIDEAVRLADDLLAHFADREAGGFFYTAHDHEALIARQKDALDSSTPSGNALAATALLRLAKLCGRADYRQAAEGTLRAFARLIENSPSGAGQMLIALDFLHGPTPELVLAGDLESDEMRDVLQDLRRRYLPNRVLAAASPGAVAEAGPLRDLLAGKTAAAGAVTLYVCENFACQAPVSGTTAIRAALDKLAVK